MMDLCDYQNKTFSFDKVDDNYHTGELGAGVHVSLEFLCIKQYIKVSNASLANIVC